MSNEAIAFDNPLAEIRARLRAERDRIAQFNWTPPPEASDEPKFGDYRLKPMPMTSLAPLPAPLSLAEVRARLPIHIHEYLDSASKAAMLVRLQPGAGKTHTAVAVAQFFARRGLKGLWCASRHNMFDDLANFEHFDSKLWYHWRGIQGELEDEPVCRYKEAQKKWSELGYESMALCRQLCGKHADNWIKHCPYRLQEKRRQPLIFAQHQHLTSGIAIQDFDFVIVDELPMSVFTEHRVIPMDGLDIGATGPLQALTTALASICQGAPKSGRISDKALFDQIGALLADAYAQVDLNLGSVPEPPKVFSEWEVNRQPYWYLFDLLRLAAAEHKAWEAGWTAWNPSLWCTQGGLHLLQRASLWEKLPEKIIVLDATAQPDLYRIIFEREIELYSPSVERVGKLYQVAGRLNGKSATLQHKELTPSGSEMLEVARRLTAGSKRPGFICWKALAPHVRREFGPEHVLTFGALRGTNALQECDTVTVFGTPTPDGTDMLDLAVALSGKIQPFYKYDDEGKRVPLYRYADREYRLGPEGVAVLQAQYGEQFQAVGRRTGFYADPTLDAIHRQLRESELIQAIHRARINIREATVWLLTSTPLQDEPLDGLWNDPPFGPDGIHWQIWLRIEPWLNHAWLAGQAIDNAGLAAAAGVSVNWVQRNRWLDLIAGYQSERWQISSLRPAGHGGNPKKTAIPLSATTVNSALDQN